MEKRFQEYCVGCGLCQALKKAELKTDPRGFWYPEKGDEKFLEKVCPVSGNHLDYMKKKAVWGNVEKAFLGWSANDKVREKSSSGGILTEIASFLLEEKEVDAIIQTKESENCSTETEICIHTTKTQIERSSGSRYTISHPLQIMDALEGGKRYAFIGKPCDVVVLRNYINMNPEVSEKIPFIFSFFCAGLPSINAQNELLKKLGCEEKQIVSLQYRGNGWPGKTIAIDTEGKRYDTDYDTAWGKILGRDIMRMCRVCIDGIGELADIACGDAWYLDADGKPDFSEHEGRNVILVRNKKGMQVWEKLVKKERVVWEEFPNYELQLKKMQPYQYKRKVTMFAKILALYSQKRPFPRYNMKQMIGYACKGNAHMQWDIYKGTVRRIKDNQF